MNWEKWDIVALGRTAGVVIMLVGAAVAGWEAVDQPDGITSFSTRAFMFSVLNYTWSGAILILIAEIAERLGWLDAGSGASEANDDVVSGSKEEEEG